MPRRVVVLASGAGSNLQALLDRPTLGGGEVAAVLTDVPGAGAVDRAAAAGVAAACVDRGGYRDRASWETELAARTAAAEPDLVVLAGFMRILSASFVARWPLLNVHPSLLPAFPGATAVRDALDHGVKVTGVTVHFVVEQVDAGPIVAQEPVPVHDDDDEASLHARLRVVEHRLLPRCVEAFCAGRLRIDGRHVRSVP